MDQVSDPAAGAIGAIVSELTGCSGNPAPRAGFQFDVGGYRIELIRDERDHEFVIVDLSLLSLRLADPNDRLSALRTLHLINHAGRGAQDWFFTIDNESTLIMTARLSAMVLQQQPIKEFLSEALEMADSVVSLWQATSAEQTVRQTANDRTASDSNPINLLRV